MVVQKIIVIIFLFLFSGSVVAQELKDSIRYELKPGVLDAIHKAFGEPLTPPQKKFDFIRKIPGLMTDSTDIRRRLTLKPYRFDTRMDEDPIYDHMSQEIRMADGKGLSKFNYKFPDIGKGKSYDFNNFLSIIFSEKDRKKRKNQKFIKEVLLPAFNKESVKFYEKSPSAK